MYYREASVFGRPHSYCDTGKIFREVAVLEVLGESLPYLLRRLGVMWSKLTYIRRHCSPRCVNDIPTYSKKREQIKIMSLEVVLTTTSGGVGAIGE